MDDHSQPYAELGPTSPTSSVLRMPDRRIMKIATELGLRFRPLATADQEDHQAGVLLLARDLSDVDPAALQRAADEWVRTERFMPRASDLRALIRQIATPKASQQALVDQGNRYLAELGRTDVHWFLYDGRVTIGWRH